MKRVLYVLVIAFGAMAIGLTLSVSAERQTGVIQAGFGCKMVNGQLVCGKQRNNDDDDDDENQPSPKKQKTEKKKKGKGTDSNGERACPPGYVVLDKPNKYGAYCEPKEGFPAKPPAEAEKCKFPGQVGTPPNCTCPDGTEFLGLQGVRRIQDGSILQRPRCDRLGCLL